MTDNKVRIVIPSLSRHEECKNTLRFFPDALVCPREDQVDIYSKIGAVELMPYPVDIGGIAPLRNWILDNVPDETVFIMDDDMVKFTVDIGMTLHKRIDDPVAIRQVVENSAYIAKEIGTNVFGFSQTFGDVRKINLTNPIGFATWVGGEIGIIGREFRYDDTLRIRADIDYCLQVMRVKRIIYVDKRFSFIHKPRFTHKGGNAENRTLERNQAEIAYLKRKWKAHLEVKMAKTTTRLVVHVKRKQV